MGRKRHSDEDNDQETPSESRPAFPTTVRIAGIIWIVVGCVAFFNGCSSFVLNPGAMMAEGPLGTLLVFVVGAVFLMVGVQSVRGTARDTLGNAIGSLVFALLNLCVSGVIITTGFNLGGEKGTVTAILGGFSSLLGLGLLVAGILALVGRADYRAWRDAEKKKQAPPVSDTDPPPMDHNH